MTEYRNHTLTVTDRGVRAEGEFFVCNTFPTEAKAVAAIDQAYADREILPLLRKLIHNGDASTLVAQDEAPEVGQTRYVYAMGAYRRGTVVKVTKMKTTVAYTTASNPDRVYRKADNHENVFMAPPVKVSETVQRPASPETVASTPEPDEAVSEALSPASASVPAGGFPSPYAVAMLADLVPGPGWLTRYPRAEILREALAELEGRGFMAQIPGLSVWGVTEAGKEFTRKCILS